MPRRKSYEIKVIVRMKRGKPCLRFRDPLTGLEQIRWPTKSTPSEIQREAGAWERELKEDQGKKLLETKRLEEEATVAKVGVCTWDAFIARFDEEHLLSLAEDSSKAFTTALVQFKRHTPNFPSLVSGITATHISQFAAQYRSTGVSEATIEQRLRHVKAAFSWAKATGILHTIPKFPVVKRARKGQRVKPAKGRPISPEEFAAILEAIPAVISSENEGKALTQWKRFLNGLWWSGLRLDEALELSWDESSGKMWVDMNRFDHPMLIIPADEEKGGKDRIYPMAPEFAEMLREDLLAADSRSPTGLVFPLVVRRSKQNEGKAQIGRAAASAQIISICRKAGVITHYSGKDRKPQPGGAQGFRRAFGTRWCRRVLPQVLQQMMRHESIETTMRYYVGITADDLASDIYAAYAKFTVPGLSPATSPDTNKEGRLTAQQESGVF